MARNGNRSPADSLHFDGGSEIYRYAFYHWDGESDEFTVHSLTGLERCQNLTVFDETSLIEDPDLSPLASLSRLHTIGLAPGPRTNAHVLATLPALRRLTCFEKSIPDPDLIEQLRAKGVEVTVY